MRTVAACEPAEPLFARRTLYHAKPPAAASTTLRSIQIPNLRGLRGAGWRIAGGGTWGGGTRADNVLGTEALLM
jgi:hypothetical protein